MATCGSSAELFGYAVLCGQQVFSGDSVHWNLLCSMTLMSSIFMPAQSHKIY